MINSNGEVKLGEVFIYFISEEPKKRIYFTFSEEIQGLGTFCEKTNCPQDCQKDNCPGNLKIETTELIYGKEISKVLKLSYEGEGKFWLWLGPNLRKLCHKERIFSLEILTKEKINNSVVILQWVISETQEILGSFNITEELNQPHCWKRIEIPLGIGGFELNWLKLSNPGTLTLEIKILPLDEHKDVKGKFYLRTLAIK